MTCAGPGGGRGESGGGEHGVSGGARGARDGTPTAAGRARPAFPVPPAERSRYRLRAGPCEPRRPRERWAGVGRLPRRSPVKAGASFPAGEEGAALKAVGAAVLVLRGYVDVLEPWSLPQGEGFDVTNILEEGCPFSARLIFCLPMCGSSTAGVSLILKSGLALCK